MYHLNKGQHKAETFHQDHDPHSLISVPLKLSENKKIFSIAENVQNPKYKIVSNLENSISIFAFVQQERFSFSKTCITNSFKEILENFLFSEFQKFFLFLECFPPMVIKYEFPKNKKVVK